MRDGVREVGRQVPAHLQQLSTDGQAESAGELVVIGGRVEHPPVHRAAAGAADDVERLGHELRSERALFAPVRRIDDELDRRGAVPVRNLGVPDRAPVIARDDCREPLAAAGNEVEPVLVRQRLAAVRGLGGGEQPVDRGDHVGVEAAQDLEGAHGSTVVVVAHSVLPRSS